MLFANVTQSKHLQVLPRMRGTFFKTLIIETKINNKYEEDNLWNIGTSNIYSIGNGDRQLVWP